MFHYLLAIVIILFGYLFFIRKNDPRLPPGLYGWPFVGTFPLFQIASPAKVEEYRKKFGDIFMWRTGVQETVYICNPKLIRKAFSHPDLLDRPKQIFTIDSMTLFEKIGIINSNGENWNIHRKFFLRHLKESGFGKSKMEPIINREVKILIKKFKEYFSKGPATLPLSVTSATISVIWKLAADIEFEEGEEILEKLTEAVNLHLTLMQKGIMYFDLYPWLLPICPQFLLDKLGFAAVQQVRNVVTDYIKDVIEDKKASLDLTNPNGLIQSYLVEINNASKQDSYFNERSLIVGLSELILAGGDDVSSTIRWSLQIIARNPLTQVKIQEEIDSSVPRDRLPSLNDKPNLPYTEAAVCEAMRLGTVAPLGLFHAASKDLMIDNYHIPKGTLVTPFIQRCHTDAEYWQKPNEYHPEHFLDSEGNFTPYKEAFMPFSTGRRACLGENLARVELLLFISALLQNFSFKVDEGDETSLEATSDSVVFNLAPQTKLIVKERM